MKKGVLEMCLLYLVAGGDSYGYELIQKMVAAFSDLPERTVYTILRRLHENGYTQTYTKDISAGPPRKYYRVTEKGKEYLERSIQDWNNLQGAVESVGILMQ
jgi:PadR family transcriptional regulator PadR